MSSDSNASTDTSPERRWKLSHESEGTWEWLDGLPGHVLDRLLPDGKVGRLTEEEVLTLAMFKYLSGVHFTQFAGWTISQPYARYQASRWVAIQYTNMRRALGELRFDLAIPDIEEVPAVAIEVAGDGDRV